VCLDRDGALQSSSMGFFRSSIATGGVALAMSVACACTLSTEGLDPEGSGSGAGSSTGGSGAGATGAGTATGGGTTGGGATGGGATGGASGGGTGGVGECGANAECVPVSSEGTYVVVGPEGASACPAGWNGLADYGDGVDPGCDACPGCMLVGACPKVTVELWEHANCNQNGDTASFPLDDGECFDILTAATSDLVASASGYRVTAAPTVLGVCTPVPATPSPLANGASACLLEDPLGAACDGGNGVCLPEGNVELSEVCVLLDGAMTCPAALPNEKPVSRVMVDDRSCSCTCGAEDASCVGAQVTGHVDQVCGGGAVATQAADGVCNDTAGLGIIFSILGDTGAYAGSCPGVDATTGTVTFDAEQKFCCAP